MKTFLKLKSFKMSTPFPALPNPGYPSWVCTFSWCTACETTVLLLAPAGRFITTWGKPIDTEGLGRTKFQKYKVFKKMKNFKSKKFSKSQPPSCLTKPRVPPYWGIRFIRSTASCWSLHHYMGQTNRRMGGSPEQDGSKKNTYLYKKLHVVRLH